MYRLNWNSILCRKDYCNKLNGDDIHSFISISFHVSCGLPKNDIIVHLSINVQIYSFSFVWINILCSFVKVCVSLRTSNNKHLSADGNWTEMYDWKQGRVQYRVVVKVEITKHSKTKDNNTRKHYLCYHGNVKLLSYRLIVIETSTDFVSKKYFYPLTYVNFYGIATVKDTNLIDDLMLLYFPWFVVKLCAFASFLFVFT